MIVTNKIIDLTGNEYGMLTVIRRDFSNKKKKTLLVVQL